MTRARFPPRSAGALAIALLAIALVFLLVYGVLSKATDTTVDDGLSRAKATPAPGFELPVLQRGAVEPELQARIAPAFADGRLALDELRGKPVIVNFWASWCAPCREEAPVLEAGRAEAERLGAVLIGLDMQDVTSDARAFLRQYQVGYPIVRDRGNGVARRWGATGIPETYFVDRRGRIVAHVIGQISPAQLRRGTLAAVGGRAIPVEQGGARKASG